MVFYNPEGHVMGHPYRQDAMYSMKFEVNGRSTLRLRVADKTTQNIKCGLKSVEIIEWLWEKGNEFLSNGSIPTKTFITLKDDDISNGVIVTEVEFLQKEEWIEEL